MPALSEQKAILSGHLANIKAQSAHMRQCLAENALLPALKHCSNMLNELRTSQLTPKFYYELYMATFDSLEVLLVYLLARHNKRARAAEALAADEAALTAAVEAPSASSGGVPPTLSSPQGQGVPKEVPPTLSPPNLSPPTLSPPTNHPPPKQPFLADLYELVQYSGNIIPRLYMMVVVGTTYMATPNAPTKELMRDMLEMCRGVQHPVRGLFLRYYLLQRIKALLPLSTRGEFDETVEFLVANFIEMNKLWVRLQHQGHSLERLVRLQERRELKILVGLNLVRLLQAVDDFGGDAYEPVQYYRDRIFPLITEQIIQCRDPLAQSYLVDVIIQVFPVTFHLATLGELLTLVLSLNIQLSKSELVLALVDRLAGDDAAGGEGGAAVFATFWDFYQRLAEVDAEMGAAEHSGMLQAFVKLLLRGGDSAGGLDEVFRVAAERATAATAAETAAAAAGAEAGADAAAGAPVWLDLLLLPIAQFRPIQALLAIPHFRLLYSAMAPPQQHQVSLAIAERLLGTRLDTAEIDGVFPYLSVLIEDQSALRMSTARQLGVTPSFQTAAATVPKSFLQVQETVSKAVHLVTGADAHKSLANLMHLRKRYYSKGGANVLYTYPTLVSQMLHHLRLAGHRRARAAAAGDTETLVLTTNFKHLLATIDELYQTHPSHLELILQLYLSAAAVADQLELELIAYEFFTQCFIVYEENLILNTGGAASPHSAMGGGLVPYQLVLAIASKLAALRCFLRDNYENFITKVTLYGSKLLKKHDQCRAVYHCAHLWWWCESHVDGSPTVEGGDGGLYRDPKRVLECLQKALRVADLCMNPFLSLRLFVEILDRCLIFYVYGNPTVDARYINGLIELIRTNLESLKGDADDDEAVFASIRGSFERTLAYIEEQRVEDRFSDIVV